MTDELERLSYADMTRIRAAAYHAKKKYPGLAGQILSEEILAWTEFGYVLGTGRINQLVDELMRPDELTS